MTALQAFELLMRCAVARRADAGGTHYGNHREVAEKNAALDAVIDVLGTELRKILTPAFEDDAPKFPPGEWDEEKVRAFNNFVPSEKVEHGDGG